MHVTLRHVAGADELELPMKRIAYLIRGCRPGAVAVRLSSNVRSMSGLLPGALTSSIVRGTS